MNRYRIVWAASIASCLAPPIAHAAGEVDKGREIAVTHCSRCHVVPDYNPHGGIDSTPKLARLANFPDGMERFQTFYARRPHPVFVRMEGQEKLSNAPSYAAEFVMTAEQLQDLLAYAETLRTAD